MEIIDYKVQLENFYGPLDLLLYLIKENELNIYDIPISRVTEQYLNYLEMMRKLDINLAGEFLVLASTLMEIKARMLVPVYEDDETADEEPEDPRFELVKKLLEYKKYKDVSVKLRHLLEQQAQTFPRPYIKPDVPEPDEIQVELDLWQLVRAFARLNKEIILDIPISLLYDDIPLEKIIEGIIERLKEKKEVLFSELVKQGRIDIVRNFLATLELARRQSVEIEQKNDFEDIRIKLI
jgi:segregation and condensation protein A